MTLSETATSILGQLSDLVHQMHEEDFSKSCETLSGSTIGQHVRHTLEFFLCLEKGYGDGVVNYDNRAHDGLIERDKNLALATIRQVTAFISILDHHRSLTLEVAYHRWQEPGVRIETNAHRELVYNIEHAVHHMAIMRIGIREIAPYVCLSPDFGIAASTVKHRTTDVEASGRRL